MMYSYSSVGSSPRVRGTLQALVDLIYRSRFIPAGAGEHAMIVITSRKDGGSSPRVRGTHDQQGAGRPVRRFIPAGAGNTRRPAARGVCPPVHPRGCGEHEKRGAEFTHRLGSSPRVRGTRSGGFTCHDCLRFIPAGAGNTLVTVTSSNARTVHPRGCGEHIILERSGSASVGSSPRVRGTRRFS